MYALRDVDAVRQVSPWAGNGRKKHYGLLPKLREENDSNAYVRRLRIWEWRMER